MSSLLVSSIRVTKRIESSLTLLLMMVALSRALFAAEPLKLHAQNPHYFLFRGQPTVLITSGEHYGAVLNMDFDYRAYLDEIQSRNLNLTRIFPGGPYFEAQGSFNIASNTLAPDFARFSCIWSRSTTPGYVGGGNEFDLESWNETHLARLRDFVSQAGKRGVVVEISLFCPFYEDKLWDISPLKAKNNINRVGEVSRTDVYTLKSRGLLASSSMVPKLYRVVGFRQCLRGDLQ